MKVYPVVILAIVFLVGNYYAVELAFMGMTYNNDFTFFAGLMGLGLLVISDIQIVVRVVKNCLPKKPTGEEEKQ